jgi:hypothetical protein
MLLINNLLSIEQCKGTKDHDIVHNPPMLFLGELLYFFDLKNKILTHKKTICEKRSYIARF